MVSDVDFRDAAFCHRLVQRAFAERNLKAIRSLFDKISAIFVFSPEEFRKEIVEQLFSEISTWPYDEALDVSKESVLGNVLLVYYFIRKIGVITPEKLEIFASLSRLNFIEDPLTFEFIPIKGAIILDLTSQGKPSLRASIVERAIEVCELFFMNGRMERSKDTIEGMVLLYENSRRAERRFKGRIASALLNKRMDLFLGLIKKIREDVNNKAGLLKHYVEIYDLLARFRFPVFFDSENFTVEYDRFYNGNFYFARFLDKEGNEHLLFPFEQVDVAEVQQIFHLGIETFVAPRGRIGKITLQSIYSFRKMRKIVEANEDQVQTTRKMLENEIEARIRAILEDQNVTSHGPAEKTDIYEHKILVNNENDLRDAAFIIKGRGYPKVTLNDVASNIIKAMDLPVKLVLLVHTGVLLDEAKEKFVSQSDRAKKMHCIIDAVDLTKLLLAYDKFST